MKDSPQIFFKINIVFTNSGSLQRTGFMFSEWAGCVCQLSTLTQLAFNRIENIAVQ